MRVRGAVSGVIAAALVCAAGVAWAKGGKAAPPAPAAAPRLLAAVTGPDGKPAAGAHVVLLGRATSDVRGNWLPSTNGAATSDAKGVASFTSSSDPACLLAWTDKQAGLACNQPLAKPPATMPVALGPGMRLTGHVLGPDGKPVAGTRARVRAPGGYEWHHFDADVGADGALILPTLPADLVRHAEAVLEFVAPGFPMVSRALGPATTDAPLDLRFPAPRRVKGRLVGADGRPVVGAVVHTPQWADGPKCEADAKGLFDFGPLAADVRRIHVVSKSHGDAAADVPEGDGTIDLGDVTLPPGAPVKVRVTEADGRNILRAFVVLHDADDFRVGEIEAAGPEFQFPHVGEASYTLHVYVHELEGAKSWRHVVRTDVRAGGETIDVAMPSGLVVKLVDAGGKPAPVAEARVLCEFAPGKEPWTETFQSMPRQPDFSEIRYGPMPPSQTITVTVTAKGRAPVVVKDVEIDAEGCGTATATLPK